MSLPGEVRGRYGVAGIETANEDDLPEIYALFDEAIEWLIGKGIDGQWGTTPMSALPEMRLHFMEWIGAKELYLARKGGELVGVFVLGKSLPRYAANLTVLRQNFSDEALYLEAFTTARSLVGQGLGRDLLRWAEEHARQQGKSALWLDCWADNPALCDYYRGAGFVPVVQFGVKDWRGQLFQKDL